MTKCMYAFASQLKRITDAILSLYESYFRPDMMTFQEYTIADAVQVAKVC